jgi:hypothetical protein
MKPDVIRKRSQHDTCGSSASHGSGHSTETPSASPGASRRPSPLGDADGGVSPKLAFDSNPIAIDDIDVDPPSNHNGYVPPTQSEHNMYSYPGLNLSIFPGQYHPDLLSQLYFANYSTNSGDGRAQRFRYGIVTHPPALCHMHLGTVLALGCVLFLFFADSGFSTSSAGVCFLVCAALLGISLFGSSSSPSNDCGSPNSGSCNVPKCNNGSESGVGGYYSAYWHPPMLPQLHGSLFIHPPILPPAPATECDMQMDFLHGQTGMNEGNHFLNPYIHSPNVAP